MGLYLEEGFLIGPPTKMLTIFGGLPLLMDFERFAFCDHLHENILRDRKFVTASVNETTAFENPQVFYKTGKFCDRLVSVWTVARKIIYLMVLG